MTARSNGETLAFPSIGLAEIYEQHAKEIERLQEKLGEAWQTIGGLKYHYRQAVEEAEKLKAKIRELEERGSVDDQIVRDALMEKLELEVTREWSEDRYPGTSNHYREHFAEYAAGGPITIEIDTDVERRLPRRDLVPTGRPAGARGGGPLRAGAGLDREAPGTLGLLRGVRSLGLKREAEAVPDVQRRLFGREYQRPLVERSRPGAHNRTDTSRAAAHRRRLKAGTARWTVYQAIAAAGRQGMTIDEIVLETGLLTQTVCGRISELRKDGLIQDSGHQRKTRTGSPAIVWVVR
ncbi:MAG: hypothetical protein GXP27_07295 [Planctomycetes bacterium]|nr:hypothetical protein [Planctomycetota bacterium]